MRLGFIVTHLKPKCGRNNGMQMHLQGKSVLFAGKVMAIVFWGQSLFRKRKAITGTYYASLLDKLKAEIKENRLYLKKKRFCSTRIKQRHTLRGLSDFSSPQFQS